MGNIQIQGKKKKKKKSITSWVDQANINLQQSLKNIMVSVAGLET